MTSASKESIVSFLILIVFFSTLSVSNSFLSDEEVKACSLIHSGYDITTYYHEEAPKEGSSTYQAVYQERKYFFVSEKNRKLFTENPKKLSLIHI